MLLVAVVLAFATSVLAAEHYFIKKNETFCDSSGLLCLYGSLSYRVNPRILSLHARVGKKTGPGLIRIRLSGVNRQNMQRFTEINVEIRGTYSEIIDHKMRPDAADVSAWKIASFAFELMQDQPRKKGES